jgi:serine phosphatase RsbU (regulator of sigma subunit)
MLVSYTDGVTDAVGEHGQRFGPARLAETLQRGHTRSARSLIEMLAAALEQFQSGAHADDTAVLALHRLPTEPPQAEPDETSASPRPGLTIPV